MTTAASADRFVLDGSVTLAWLFDDEQDPYADAIVAKHLTEYDAAYLELALREGLPLATLDAPLEAAATAVGVARYQP